MEKMPFIMSWMFFSLFIGIADLYLFNYGVYLAFQDRTLAALTVLGLCLLSYLVSIITMLFIGIRHIKGWKLLHSILSAGISILLFILPYMIFY